MVCCDCGWYLRKIAFGTSHGLRGLGERLTRNGRSHSRFFDGASKSRASRSSPGSLQICGQRRPGFSVQPAVLRRALLDGGWLELPIEAHHAQASVEGVLLITTDQQLAHYPAPVRLMLPSR